MPDSLLPFFLYASATFDSRATASPTVWTPLLYTQAATRDLQAINIHK
jgi:hypothetical protein